MNSRIRKTFYDLSDPALPTARHEERQLLIDLLRVEPHHSVLDIPAWGGYLAHGLKPLVADPKQIICIEPSARFVLGLEEFTATCHALAPIPLRDVRVDRVGSLVGLHHLPDKLAFIHETFRVLKPGGRVALSEVCEDSAVARFLNGSVNQYTTGHHGMFVRPGECRALLERAGFMNIVEEMHDLHWRFQTMIEMARFCRHLLGMTKASELQVLEALQTHFAVKATPDEVKLPWSLVYCVGTKPSE